MNLLYGTTNPGKLASMNRALAPLGLTLTGLAELDVPLPPVEETGTTLLENAEQKARAYYAAFGRPVFSCDSGLYFDELSDAEQPGPYVRRVGGRSLTDAEAQEYYAALARRHGGRLTGRFRNAIFLMADGETWPRLPSGWWKRPIPAMWRASLWTPCPWTPPRGGTTMIWVWPWLTSPVSMRASGPFFGASCPSSRARCDRKQTS